MKKVIGVVLSAMLFTSIVGCGKEKEEKPKTISEKVSDSMKESNEKKEQVLSEQEKQIRENQIEILSKAIENKDRMLEEVKLKSDLGYRYIKIFSESLSTVDVEKLKEEDEDLCALYTLFSSIIIDLIDYYTDDITTCYDSAEENFEVLSVLFKEYKEK